MLHDNQRSKFALTTADWLPGCSCCDLVQPNPLRGTSIINYHKYSRHTLHCGCVDPTCRSQSPPLRRSCRRYFCR